MDNIIVGSQEWLDIRRTKITATDIPVILGVSKFKTLRQLYDEKKTGREPERNFAMNRGIQMEEDARRAYEALKGEFVFPSFLIREWACASLDGINENGVMVELKCPGKIDHETALRGVVPEHYYPQCQWQMYVAQKKFPSVTQMDYFSYSPNHPDPVATVVVSYDAEFIEKAKIRAEEFLEAIELGIPPEGEIEEVRPLDPNMEEQEVRAVYLLKAIKKMEDEYEAIRKDLIDSCKGHTSVGRYLKLSCVRSKGSIEYGKIPQLKGINLEAYRKDPVMKWRIDEL